MVTLGSDLRTSRRSKAASRSNGKAKIVGAIGVSGAASAQQDEELAIVGAKSLDIDGHGEHGQRPYRRFQSPTSKARKCRHPLRRVRCWSVRTKP